MGVLSLPLLVPSVLLPSGSFLCLSLVNLKVLGGRQAGRQPHQDRVFLNVFGFLETKLTNIADIRDV